MDLGCPSTDRHEICTHSWGWIAADNLRSKIFLPDPQKIWRGKTSIFEDSHQLEEHNFETAQHIDRRISDVLSRINVLQNGIKLASSSPRDFSAT